MRKLLIIILFFSCVGNSDTQGIKPLNIIILIGDGMGLPQITGGTYANNNESELENFKNIGLIANLYLINSLWLTIEKNMFF